MAPATVGELEVNCTPVISQAWAERVKTKSPPLPRVGLVFTCASREEARHGVPLGLSREITKTGWEAWFERGFIGQEISPTWAMAHAGLVMFDRICGVALDAGYQIGDKYIDGSPVFTQVLDEDEANERLSQRLIFGGDDRKRPVEQFIRAVRSRARPGLTVAAFVGPISDEWQLPDVSHVEKIRAIAERTSRFHGALHGAGVLQILDSLSAVNADKETNARLFAEIISMPGQMGPGFGVEPPGRDLDNVRYWYSMARCVVMNLDRYRTIIAEEKERVAGNVQAGKPWIGLDHLRHELRCTPYVWVVDPSLDGPEARLAEAKHIIAEDPDVGVLLPARDQTCDAVQALLATGWDNQ